MRTETPQTIYLKGYRAPDYLVDRLDLVFRIFEAKTIVHATTVFRKNHEGDRPLYLNGEHLKLLSLTLDGKTVEHSVDAEGLTIPSPGDHFTLEIETEIDPAHNTRLEGLYKSGGNWCTQCEAEGFRTITYFPDRPDVMTVFTVRIEADRDTCPVLLSNGNLSETGELADNRHYAVWHDPFPKPCYLFALVAGDLVHIEDSFTTKSGRKVALRIYVRDGDQDQCHHAMESLKKSMKWDEDVYGREYELDVFNIVAVSDFNMGAMENTSLNIFNTALVLAHPDTATDHDYLRVEGVIAHEYFHNWTGNRVTCRDWFQLSLKEGLTVFRDQEFTADMNSRDVKRIDDVALLRRLQFAEDAGPLAHPIRPDNYIEINNFYTVTVYEKGAEVIRMLHTLLGPEDYRKATDLYFERYDGMAVTCDDFVSCMEDASGRDLSQFRLWYSQAGTPRIKATGSYDEDSKTFTLSLSQETPPTPGQPEKKPLQMPVRVGLLGPNGDEITERTLELTETRQSFTFENVPSRPVPSILRGFSAPVRLETDLTQDDLRFLMVHDTDGFNKIEAGQTYALQVIQHMLDNGSSVPEDFIAAYGDVLGKALDPREDKALMARAVYIPDVSRIAQEQQIVDPQAIYETREKLLNSLLEAHKDKLHRLYEENRDQGDFSVTPEAMGRRALKNSAMLMLANKRTIEDARLCKQAYDTASNMTDRMAALYGLVVMKAPEREAALKDFYDRFKSYPLVIDKWFSAQAIAVRDDIMEQVNALTAHHDFTFKNPNRVRSLYAAFAMNNPVAFHHVSGSGYRFLADAIIELNGINPQIAARMMTPFKDWKRYTPERQQQIRTQLEKIANTPELSRDVYEIVTKSLKG